MKRYRIITLIYIVLLFGGLLGSLTLTGHYFADFTSAEGCIGAKTEAALRQNLPLRDALKQWKTTVQQTLPLGQASIFLAPGETADANRRQLGEMIAWRENEREGTKTADIDASKVRGADGTFSAGTDAENACPDGFTCHLQYLPVSARCAPYGGSGTSVVFCI